MNNTTNRMMTAQRLPAVKGAPSINLFLIDNLDGTSSLYVSDGKGIYFSTSAEIQDFVDAGLISGEVQSFTIQGMVFVIGQGTPGVLAQFGGASSIKDSRISQGTSGSDPTTINGPSVGNLLNLLSTGEIQARVVSFGLDVYGGAGGAPFMLLVPDNAALGAKGMGLAVSLDGHTLSFTDKLLFPMMDITDAGVLKLLVAGGGLQVKEGVNACMGTATLNGATEVTVTTNKVTANSRIFLSIQSPAGTPAGAIYVSSRNPGVSFGVKGVALDTSDFAWMIVEPS